MKKYDFELQNIIDNNLKVYNLIDNQQGLKNMLMISTDIFPESISAFHLNSEISQYLYKNELYKKHNFLNDIIGEYKKLYTDILVPTDSLRSKIHKLIQNKKNIVGIQIRCGDVFMVTNQHETHNTQLSNGIDKKLLRIKNNCDINFKDYNIYFTTDNSKLYDIAIKIFSKSKIIYDNSLIQHLDRKNIQSDFSKTFVDNMILSQKTKALYISKCSNFGRIAALSCNHNNIYDLNTNIINKKDILSKQEMLF